MAEVTIDEAIRIAIGHQQAGRAAEAEQIYRLVLEKQPNNSDALQLLGVTLAQTGRAEEGVAQLRRAIAVRPGISDYWSNLGNALRVLGRLDESVEACRCAVEMNPALAEAHNNLGIALREKKQVEESIEAYREAIRLKPTLAEAHNNLGHSLTLQQRFEEAIEVYREALRLRPDYAEVLSNLGTVLADTGRIDEAVAALRQALRINPSFADAYSNLGQALTAAGKDDEALVMSRRATALDPRNAGYHWNLALELLGRGMFGEGWKEFEWRWGWKDFRAPRGSFSQPLWEGEDLIGRAILLHFEQGLGDTLQFVRYGPMVRERGGQVIFQVQRELVRLLKSNQELGQVVGPDEVVPAFDLHCTLLSLPLAFKTDLQSIPAAIPYLKADEQIAAAWGKRLDPVRGKFKVGLVWAGNVGYQRDRHRSIEFAKVLPIVRTAEVAFVNLQKGPSAQQAKAHAAELEWTDFAAELDDFAETAGLISNLNLVISVDTAVVHLAGAMGKPAWVLLPFAADWRWLRGRDDSPWYPSVRLFRQAKFGEWDGVVARVAEALEDLMREKRDGDATL